ncbi:MULTISPECIES: hypothetical protein [unclassified Cryobacterium]|uniref:hypothetical protein n=1 Tax=unclassified Cryobacterium TaxID=2649013 RepID=UPI0018CA7C67|nr:hypothetical protein [Cryobacterium sp. CAN_C3]
MTSYQPLSQQPPITPTYIGHVIGSSFGLVFVLVNSAPFALGLRIVACVLAVVVFIVIIAAFIRTTRLTRRRGRAQNETDHAVVGFTGRYWIIIGVEVIMLFGGLAIVRQVEPAAALGWIALVVGVHFFPLSRLWAPGRAQIVAIAIAMTVLGIVGLVLAFTTHNADTVTVVSGVGSGIVLLGTALIIALQTLTKRSAML